MSELPTSRPRSPSPEVLLALRSSPARAGDWAMAARYEHFARRTLLRPTPNLPRPSGAAILRRDQLVEQGAWPSPAAWQPGDRVMIPIESGDEAAARRYAEYLVEIRAQLEREPLEHNPYLGPCSIAPYSHGSGGNHRLWAIAVARLTLPPQIRVEARHDLIGIRVAQVALGFGADTLSGPVAEERRLPVAGVTRPTEASITGLRSLIEQAGLECALQEDAVPRALDTGSYTVPISLATSDPEEP